MSEPRPPARAAIRGPHAGFFVGGGASGDLINAIDWSSTPIGPMHAWPASLKAMVGTMLHSRHPMFLWWGPELVQFYNDAYLPSFGAGKHPAAMGQRGRDCWAEIWPIIWPQIDDVMSRGIASWNEDHLVPIFRNGRIEEVYWTYGYSPIFDDEARIAGTLVVCTETTRRVVAERRLRTIRRLADATSASEYVDSIVEAALRELQRAAPDVPFALIYRQHRATGAAQLSGSVGIAAADLAAVDAAARRCLSAAPEVGDTAQANPSRLPDAIAVAGGPWPEPATQLFALASKSAGLGTFVFGISPRLQFDADYREFLGDFVEQVELSAARVEASRARAEAEAGHRKLVLQAPVATGLLVGPRHVFELANDALARLVGNRELNGKAVIDAVPEVAGTPLIAILDGVYQTGEPFVTNEFRVYLDRRGTGVPEECFLKFTVEPLRDGSGAIYGLIGVAIDITEQVEARRALERTNAERQKLLAQLESANEAKDQFLATVSHELRTPLTAMLGWARILRAGESDPARIQKGLAVIERNAKGQAQLIDDILDISRIVAGKARLSMRRVDVAAVIKSAVETTRPAAEAKQIQLRIDAAPVGELVADEDRLLQIVGNLLSNAVKFTPSGGAVVVDAARRDAAITIRVRDTGRGISAEFLPHVFDRFRQDDASSTKQQAGLGLGLAIVHHLVELHGGSVVAHSGGEGQGATFEVTLPIREARAESATVDNPRLGLPGSTHDPRRALAGVVVLVVDDQEDARELVAMVLEGAGARVQQADSVAAALRVLSAGETQVIVSDLGMPGEDGFALLRRIRASDSARERDVPALALTAYARNEDRDRALASGFQQYASKPIDPARLVKLVASLVR